MSMSKMSCSVRYGADRKIWLDGYKLNIEQQILVVDDGSFGFDSWTGNIFSQF